MVLGGLAVAVLHYGQVVFGLHKLATFEVVI